MSKFIGLISLMLLLVLFLGVNVTADRVLSGTRLDLTEGGLYTISDASERIAATPEETLSFRFYYSKDLARGIPQLEAFGRRVHEMLESFANASGGKITFEVINPEPFSEAEDRAVAEGLSPQPVSQTENLYFGLVATNTLDGREVIPVFRPEEERFLEYRIASMITKLALPDKPRVGVITSLPMGGGFDQRTQRPRAEWAVLSELRASFDVEMIEPAAGELPAGLDALLVVHPKTITPETVYAIDQYVLGGGKAVFFVDPVCEADQRQQQPGMMQVGQDRSSDLPGLFGAWGVSLAEGQLVGDLDLAITVRLPGPVPEAVPYLIWLRVGEDQMPDDDPVTGNLTMLNIASPGFFEMSEDAAVTMVPLIETTDQAAPIARERVEALPDPKGLLNDFFPTGEPLVLAARLTGSPSTAFPGGPPVSDVLDDDEAESDASAASASASGEAVSDQIMEATEPINVIVVADADMLEDGGWVQESRLGQMLLGYNVYADNGAFAVNAVEQMAGSTDLLELRGRGTFTRPFTMLEQMRRDADAEMLSRKAVGEEELQQIESRLDELLRGQIASGANQIVLTPELQAEADTLREKQLEIRKELRQIELDVRKDAEALETRLKLINTGLVPVLLCGFAFTLGGYRAARRRADRKRGSAR